MSMFEFIKVPRRVLSILAVYPIRESSLIYKIRFLFTLVSVLILASCLTYHAALQGSNIVRLSESLNVLIAIYNSIIKVVIMSLKRKEYFKCFDMLETTSFATYNEQYDSGLKQLEKFCFKIQTNFLYVSNFALFFYAVYPVFGSMPLPLDFTYFNSGIFHYPFYIFEVVAMYTFAHTNIGLDFLAMSLILISVTQLRKLNAKLVDMEENVRRLPNYSEENCENLTSEYLKECCLHYSDIVEFSECIQDCISITSFSQMVTSCVSICNSLMLLTTVSPISAQAVALFTYAACMLGALGEYCWAGNFVFDESLEVLTSCYFTSWYQNSPRVRRYLFILMERAKRPIEIKGLGLITLNLATIITILKWTYSYFTLLEDIN